MKKPILLVLVIVALLATPAAANRCYVGGNAKKQVCICIIGGRSHGMPMRVCR